MRIGANPRAARAVLALLVGLLAGAWVGGGLVWVFNRSKMRESGGDVAALSLAPADEFDLIPADAAGFVHVRVPELWKTEAMADYRRVLDRAGDDAFKALDDGYAPAPSTIDRVTIVGVPRPAKKAPGGPPNPFVPPGKGKGGVPPPPPPPADDTADVDAVFVLTFTAPFDPAKVREAYLPDANKQAVGDHEFWSNAAGNGMAFRGDRTLVAGSEAAVKALLGRTRTPEGPLAPALKLAAGGTRHVVAAWNLKAYRKNLSRTLPPEAAAVVRADAVTAGLVVGRGARLDLRAAYKDADAATAAEGDVRKGIEAGRKSLAETRKSMIERMTVKPGDPKRRLEQLPTDVFALLGLGGVGTLDDWLANAALERDGAELSAKVSVESLSGTYNAGAAVWLGVLLNPLRTVGGFAPAPPAAQNNLRQFGIALHSYHDVNNRFPAAGTTNPPNSPRGRPLLSWRVAILPYVGEGALYNQFKQDEPWDGPNNIKLLDRMPKVFASPRGAAPPGKTHYQVFTTAESAQVKTMFGRTVGRRLPDVTDGTSNTIMVVEAAEPVEWTRPMDLPFDPDDDPPPLGLPGAGGFNAVLGDGTVRFFPAATRPEALRIWIGANDGIPNPRE